MKPVHLEFSGINSFSEKTEIDFEKLLEFGLFGIFGDTGSGKSTILDCIGFALYGSVKRCPRPFSLTDIINHKQDSAYVNFDFEIVYEGRRRKFRVERSVKRSSKGASKSTVVYEYIDGKQFALTSNTTAADELLKRIIGLEQDDFEKCTALPQGEFAEFLKAGRRERLILVARLFGLERYGIELTAKVNKKAADAERDGKLYEVKLEPYAEITAEGNAALAEEIESLRKQEADAGERLIAAREEEKKLSAAIERKREWERVTRRRAELTARQAQMEELGRELSRLEKAAFVVAAEEDGKALRAQSVRAKENFETAKIRLARAQENFSVLAEWDEAFVDAEIEQLVLLQTKASTAEQTERRKQRATSRLAEIDRECDAIAKSFIGFSYADERAKLLEKRKELGEGDFARFVEEYGKAALFRGEYAAFARELADLTEIYPEIGEDSEPLIEKYTVLSTGNAIAFSDLRAKYEAREEAKSAVESALLRLETKRGEYELSQKRIRQLCAEKQALAEEISACEKELGGEYASPQEIAKTLEEKKLLRRRTLERRNAFAEELSKAKAACGAAEAILNNAEAALEAAKARFRDTLKAGGFSNAEEAELLAAKYPDPERAKSEFELYKSELSAIEARRKELTGEDFSAVTEERLTKVRKSLAESEEFVRTASKQLALAERKLAEGKERLLEKKALEREQAAARKKEDQFKFLKKLLADNKFMEFVAEEYLQTVAVNASMRLVTLTDGRYFLRYDGGFYVGDNFNGGQLRGVHTLSGGETFLVSLSLALALGAEICARSLRPIEFFFLDEGFGTLDSRLVDTVMDSLEKLRNEHFSIGIISHVGELKNRIERKLLVTKATEQHGSVIKAE